MIELLSFYLAVAAGFLVGRLLRSRVNVASKVLMYLLIYVLLPILVFKSLLDEYAIFLSSFLTLAGFYALGVSVSYVIASIAFRGYDRMTHHTAVLASVLRNAFFIPVSLVIALGLPEMTIIGVVVFTMCYHFFQPFFTMFMAMRMHGTYANDVIIKGLTFPPLWAAIFGVLLASRGINFTMPGFHELKIFTSYFSLFYVGLVLSKAPKTTSRDRKIIRNVALIRLLIVPLIAFPLFYRLDRPMNVVIAWELGSPTSVSAVLYAVLFGFDDVLMAKIVVYVTFIGVLVLPVWMFILS